ncbi:MAG: DUF2177 family protein [Candidatus Babeliales bacterium]
MIFWYWIKIFLVGYVTFILLDLLWFGLIMRDFYIEQLAHKARVVNSGLLIHWPIALFVWFLLVIGLMVFVLPKVIGISVIYQFLYGAFFGLVVYGIYQGTNFAILSSWPLMLVWVDIAWGMIINGIMTIFLAYIFRWLS